MVFKATRLNNMVANEELQLVESLQSKDRT